MKKNENHPFRLHTIPFLIFFLLGIVAPYTLNAESISSYSTSIRITKTGTISVNEQINYDFGEKEKHGIFRSIPLVSKDGPRIKIIPISVTDENGNAFQYLTKIIGNNFEYTIGDPTKTVSGQNSYTLSYDVSNVIRRQNNSDELYWNAIGNEWDVPITDTSVTLELPPDISPDAVVIYCYNGPFGDTGRTCQRKDSNNSITITTNRPLAPHEGLTFSASFPKGVINGLARRTLGEEISNFINNHQILIFILWLCLAVGYLFLLLFVSRARSGRIVIPRSLKNKSIMAEYVPPENITPFDAAAFLNRRIDAPDIVPVIIDLAVRGYIKINYIDSEGGGRTDYEFIKIKDGSDLSDFADREVFLYLFTLAGQGSVSYSSIKLSELQTLPNKGSSLIELLKVKAKANLEKNGYVIWDRSHKNDLFSVVIGFLILWALRLFQFDLFVPFLFFACITILFVRMVSRAKNFSLTPLGESALYQLLGFKEFLSLTEAGRYKLLNAPSLKPETFEQYLPYAVALGVENEWAQQFSNIATPPLEWASYNSQSFWTTNLNQFPFVSFTDSLHQLSSDIEKIPAFRSSDQSFLSGGSQGFGSGFGGGGFSGGGSGGGGGGSW